MGATYSGSGLGQDMISRRYGFVNPVPETVDLQAIGAELKIYGEIDDPNMRHFNPSLAWDGTMDEYGNPLYNIAVRSCNFAVVPKGKWYLRDGGVYSKTDVIYGLLDPISLNVRDMRKLTLSEDTPTRVKVSGIEDVRLFPRADGMHAIGFESDRVTRHLHNESAKMAEFLIKGDELKYIRTLEKPDPKVVEKNWNPADTPSKLFDFTYSPTQTWKDGEVTGEPYKGNVHGGTVLLKQKDGSYLSLVHEKFNNGTYGAIYDKFVYVTYLAEHNRHGIITRLSKPFRFGTLENIEFASGMIEHKEDFIISLGIRDCKYALCRVSKQKLIGLFNE